MREHTVYILKHLLGTATGVTVALAGVVWLSQSLRFLDFIINKGLSVFSFLRLTLLLMPSVLTVIIPIAALCSVIYTYNRLTTDRELIVLRAVGISHWGLAKPVFALGAICVAIGFLLSLVLMPAGFRAFKDEQTVLRTNFSHVLLQEGVFNNMMDELTIYVRTRDDDGKLLGILVHDSRDPQQAVTMMAEWGALVAGPAGPMFILGEGNRQEVSTENRTLRMLYFDSYTLDLSPLAETPGERHREPKERYLHELLKEPETGSEREHRDELLAEAHRRIVTPLNAIALSLIGLAAMIAGEFDRRRQWPRIAWGISGGLIYIGLSFALAGLIVKTPVMVSVYYGFPLFTSVVALFIMTRHRIAWPWRRPLAATGQA
ncbi:MAG: LPS export ABC transporter permease LptF [Alphaproteobacteria bacterium]|nr:LPS export ABC transporter permease LptF [Rhodospirillaceae bacterium]MDG2482151.1 LPS export ABC transporter permease LptF [Alphaproteobacteria bacterium]MBT6205665.1 LPS export ABC transporter permease LptF [Rhodospirillaceae bacterium]MBT6509292.1 LPS export ABC transporter permease LptF [Rhodospirillaceae bacterium]MBT7613077.1 LPS export ABC transporter permease LptF [Rhodospirillaceae bacterium]